MIKKFFTIRKKYRYIGGAVLLAIVGLLCAVIFFNGEGPAGGSAKEPVTDTIIVPVGQTEVSIDLNVDEAEAYAGMEFALSLNDENAMAFASFTPGISGAVASPFVEKDGLHYFGFFSDSNAFSADDMLGGTLRFEGYTGNETLTVTIAKMKVIRLDENKKSITTEKESPAYVFTVQRETDG